MTNTSPVESLDFDALLELLDRTTMREVVQMFVDSVPTRIATARGGLAASDAAIVATAFHTLRSGCGQLGARRLEELCAEGEREAKNAGLDGTAMRLRDIEVEFARCLAWFREHGWVDA